MARLRGGWTYEPSVGTELWLMLGPNDLGEPLTDEQLEAAWSIERESMMESCRRNANVAWRPWAWWRLSAREEQPDGRVAEAVRLAELGELWPEEIEALERNAKAARESWAWQNAGKYPRVHVPREPVEMWEAVQAIHDHVGGH